VGDAFDVLGATERMLFDISANTNQWVFERLVEAVGPKRILFGSDLPIVRMKTKRICEDGSYINLVPAGAYEGIGRFAHMREVDGPEAQEITFFLYEEIDAFRRAAENTGLGDDDIEAVFYGNAASLLNAG
jgi:predicted TIM-barrel fold metal-dependent hydrolase